MSAIISFIGSKTIALAIEPFGILCLFFESIFTFVRELANARIRLRETLEQSYVAGVQSFSVIVFSLGFISLMLILEFSFHMKLVLRQDSLVPGFSTLLMLRELGPVVTCLLLCSRVGAGIAAEIGSMKVTEQIDALRLLAIDPIEYLVIPRWFASVIASTSLALVGVAVAVVTGATLGAVSLGHSPEEFFNSMFVFTRFMDVKACVLKAATFGTIIPFVAAYHGFHCRQGSDGVGNSATSAVVQGSIFIIVADFVLTYLLYAL